MDSLLMDACLYAALLVVWCVLVKSESSCDQTEFLRSNGSCAACPVCGPGEQLSEDCGFGDGGEGFCIPCEEGKFSPDTGVAPCMRCTKCNLLNRLSATACSPTRDTQCGQCLRGYYELRSVTGEVELPCLPCSSHDTVHKECLLLTAHSSEGGVKEETFSLVLIGSATASSIFLIVLLLWAVLLTAERLKQASGGLVCVDDLQYTPWSGPAASSHTPEPAPDPPRGLSSVCHEKEVHPTSIVINVTTNMKPCSQKEDMIWEEKLQEQEEEMEKRLQTIWEIARGQSIETLDYDCVQDLSLLLDSADNRSTLRRLGQSLGVPPQVNVHLRGFQDLFHYLCTSTYTLLPHVAQAAALLPNPQVVSRIHRAVTT